MASLSVSSTFVSSPSSSTTISPRLTDEYPTSPQSSNESNLTEEDGVSAPTSAAVPPSPLPQQQPVFLEDQLAWYMSHYNAWQQQQQQHLQQVQQHHESETWFPPTYRSAAPTLLPQYDDGCQLLGDSDTDEMVYYHQQIMMHHHNVFAHPAQPITMAEEFASHHYQPILPSDAPPYYPQKQVLLSSSSSSLQWSTNNYSSQEFSSPAFGSNVC
jgi:hypothetical protein